MGFNALCLLSAVSRETERQLNMSKEQIIGDLSLHDRNS